MTKLYAGLSKLEKEAGDARAAIGGRDRSPPGSLETWEERHRRYVAMASKTRSQLRTKERMLMNIDPTYRLPLHSPLRDRD